jgi:flagellar hook-length control protein FliK
MMNIAMLQTMSATKLPQKTEQTNSANNVTRDANAFGSVFQTIVSKPNQSTQAETSQSEGLTEEVNAILATDSLDSLLEELGVEMDEAGLFVFIGEEGTPIPVDEMLTLENLTELLGLTEEQLTQIIQQLLGDEQQELTDVWSIIEQAPAILSEVISAIQGMQQNQKSDVQPKEVEQVIQFLKLVQLFGNKVDTVYNQEQQLNQLKESLIFAANQTQSLVNTQEVVKSSFQQLVQVAQSSAQQVTVKTETEAQPSVGLQQQVMQTKTVTITLPAEKPAQSEALLKEIQNLIQRSQLSGQQGNMKLFLKLFPENLGQIRIELVQKDGVLTARLLATTAIGKELLENNLNQLKAGFVAQNIQMERIDVAQSLQDTDRNTRDQNFFNNFFRQQKEEDIEDKDEDNEEDNKSFKDLLSEEV